MLEICPRNMGTNSNFIGVLGMARTTFLILQQKPLSTSLNKKSIRHDHQQACSPLPLRDLCGDIDLNLWSRGLKQLLSQQLKRNKPFHARL